MEPALMVIGLNRHSAPVAMCQRFCIGEGRHSDCLRRLSQAEGIEEVMVLASRQRTEFILWASDPTLAVNSILHLLRVEHGLKLSEWEHFYRLLDEAALIHVFRLASGLDVGSPSESPIIPEVALAWEQARATGASGRFLNAVLETAFAIAKRVARETGIGVSEDAIPAAVAELASQVFESLQGRGVVVIGTTEIGEQCASQLLRLGAGPMSVISQTREQARGLAQKLGGAAVAMEERWRYFLGADIVISCSGASRFILTRQEAERIAAERNRTPLVIVDLAMPRDIDPEVRRVDGILLCDPEALERLVLYRDTSQRSEAATQAEKIIAAEAHAFRTKLKAESIVPTVVALRHRLDEICRQELESFIQERGPFSRELDQTLHAITSQVIQKIASSLVRELKELPEKEEQDQMTAAVERLFHLKTPSPALAGTKLKGLNREPDRQTTAASTR